MTSTSVSVRSAALTITVGLAAVSWIITLRQIGGMDMGVAMPLGSFDTFLVSWVAMMAAMMLPAAVPAVMRHARVDDRRRAVPLFVGSYLAVWALAGVLVYALYRPHGYAMAGAFVIAAGVYELTRFKQHCRRRCQESLRSGWNFGLYCVGSSLGLMLMLVALGIMSLTWMIVISILVLAQKLLAPRAAIDVPIALAIVALGILIIVTPSAIPGLMPSM